MAFFWVVHLTISHQATSNPTADQFPGRLSTDTNERLDEGQDTPTFTVLALFSPPVSYTKHYWRIEITRELQNKGGNYLYPENRKWKSLSRIWLCNPVDYIVHGILQARILEWVALSLLQRIFPTQGSNPGLPHCRQILHQLSHQGSPRMTGVGSLSFFQQIFQTQKSNPGSNQLSYQGSLSKAFLLVTRASVDILAS